MKLLYIYARDHGVLNDIEMSFCSDVRFHFNPDECVLERMDETSCLPQNFFSSKSPISSEIILESISAIVGDNGAGKTSIAVFLHDLFFFGERKEHIVVYSKDGKLFCSYSIFGKQQQSLLSDTNYNKLLTAQTQINERSLSRVGRTRKEELTTTARNMSSNERTSLQLSLPPCVTKILVSDMMEHWSFIYCSNFYSQQHLIFDGSNVFDLSTSYLIKQDYRLYIDEASPRTTVNSIVCHEFYDSFRVIQWLVYCNETNFTWHIGYVKSIKLNPFKYDLKLVAHGRTTAVLRAKKTSSDVDFTFLTKNMEADSALSSVARCFLGNFLRHEIPKCKASNLSAICMFLKNRFDRDFISDQDFFCIINELIQIGNKLGINVDSCSNMLKLMDLLCKRQNAKSLNFDLSNNDDIQLLYDILKTYTFTHTTTHFVTFDLSPALSAGELAQYQLYSRLYDLKVRTDRLNKPLPKDLIIFFDEIEITIHPRLQRQLVENVIEFCEKVFVGHKLHVLFASHSPVLLSDIPSQHVVFLRRNKTTRLCENAGSINVKTFGANIHDLYRHSFFLENGLIGSFATKKIKQIQDGLKRKNPKSKVKIRQIIDAIDEPLVKGYLLQEYFNAFEPSNDEESWLKDRLAKIESKKNIGGKQ